MEKIKKYVPRIILLDTIIYALIIVALYFILAFFKLMFREWIYIVSAIIIMVGFVVGMIQLLLKIKERNIKYILIIIFIILLLLSTPMIYLFGAFAYTPEHIVEKDGKKFVAYVNGFLRTYVYYYDYKNIFIVGNQKRIEEYYGKGGFDPIENKCGYEYNVESTKYYDENGNIIKDSEKKEKNKESTIKYYNYSEKNKQDKESTIEYYNYSKKNSNKGKIKSSNNSLEANNKILYEQKINDKIAVRIVDKGAILAQRTIIGIQKTIDGGITWSEQGDVQIHNGADFVFIDEDIGFINDYGLAGTDRENSSLSVTTDGGKSFKKVNIKSSNPKKNLYIEDVPYIENDILKLRAYIIEDEERKYCYFYSENNGKDWKEMQKN